MYWSLRVASRRASGRKTPESAFSFVAIRVAAPWHCDAVTGGVAKLSLSCQLPAAQTTDSPCLSSCAERCRRADYTLFLVSRRPIILFRHPSRSLVRLPPCPQRHPALVRTSCSMPMFVFATFLVSRTLMLCCAAIGRLPGEGSFRPGLPCVQRSATASTRSLKLLRAGALNWATGETVAIKEIQLSNIPKSEIGQIMVRGLHIRCYGVEI